MSKLKTILLIDDDEATNFMNKRILRKLDIAVQIISKENGQEGLQYLQHQNEEGTYPCPELIFLDINMPVMNGWEFLDAHEQLPPEQRGKVVVVMLTTSLNYQDEQLAKQKGLLNDFMNKPLRKADVERVINKYFDTQMTVVE